MPTLPVPVFVALVLGFLVLRGCLNDRRLTPLAALVALCAAQSLVIALAQHYGWPAMRWLQPVTAALVPPLAWIAFAASALRRLKARDALHIAGPLAALVARLVAPATLDLLIPALFIGYGAAILIRSRSADGLPQHRLASGDVPGWLWAVMAGTLIASAFADVAIVAAALAGTESLRPWIITVFSSANLALIGALGLSSALDPVTPDREPPAPTQDDSDLFARLEALMAADKPYLDPDLTLARLARRLRVPAKSLSSAINRATGDNVSRYVNAARVAAAQEAIAAGDSVTQAMLAAGFGTKSNFNREFLRVTGQTPSAWRATR